MCYNFYDVIYTYTVKETGLYYLQSRYYDPQVGRFINGDEIIYLLFSERSNEFSSFAYCCNIPVNMFDATGKLPNSIKKLLNAIKGLLSAIVFEMLTMTSCVGPISLVSQIAMTIKAISNYKSNRKKESKLTYKNGYINNQNILTDWKLGYEKLSVCGCEVISVYNALKACGKTYKLSELILYFEMCGYVMLYGYFGSNPTKLGGIFSLLKIKYSSSFTFSTVESNLKQSKCGIVSCWTGKITKGLHTFMVIYDKSTKLFTSYNGYNEIDNPPYSSNKSLKNLVYSSHFIIGYSIK